MHYVALSRVTNYAGIYINDLNESQICVSKKVSHYLLDAYKNHKLQTNIQLFQKDKLNILFNNARSFKKYFHIAKNDKIILKQQINIFLESKLCKFDQNANYVIPKFIIVRADQKKAIKPHHGIIAYIYKDIKINRIEYMSRETIDSLLINIEYNAKDITFVSVYNSPQNKYTEFEKHIIQIIEKEQINAKNIILLGDFNIQISSPQYVKLSKNLLKYNMKQNISNYSTIYKTTIDYIFSTIDIYNIQNLHADWSDHNIIHFEIS